MDEMKRAIEEKKRELRRYFDGLVEAGCTCTVIRHELLPNKPRTVEVYSEYFTPQEMITSFIADALIVLRVVPVVDGAGDVTRWRFRRWDGLDQHAVRIKRFAASPPSAPARPAP